MRTNLKAVIPDPTADEVRALFVYDERTGEFTWRSDFGRGRKAGKKVGSVAGNGYVQMRVGRRTYSAHRLAWLWMTGSLPPYVDHVNGSKADNRWANLREATASQNGMNRKASKSNPIGIKGLCFSINGDGLQYIRATVTPEGGNTVDRRFSIKKLGIMVATRDAAIWAKAMREELHKEFASHRS